MQHHLAMLSLQLRSTRILLRVYDSNPLPCPYGLPLGQYIVAEAKGKRHHHNALCVSITIPSRITATALLGRQHETLSWLVLAMYKILCYIATRLLVENLLLNSTSIIPHISTMSIATEINRLQIAKNDIKLASVATEPTNCGS